MDILTLAIIAVFLPLFPFSMGFNALFSRLPLMPIRIGLLLGWPILGLLLADQLKPTIGEDLQPWIIGWALFTSALYALRMLVLRELNRWTAFMATSLWALLWLPLAHGFALQPMLYDALGFSLPLVMLAALAVMLTQRFGAAYTGLNFGLAQNMPRLALLLVLSVLAAIGTPIFPTFFSLLSLVHQATLPAILALLLIWLLWSWAGARIVKGFIVGDADTDGVCNDVSPGVNAAFMATLIALAVFGASLTGAFL